jgi:hypothetical protein
MLSDAQLDDVKTELEAERTLQDIVTNDYAGEKVGAVRGQLIDKFTAQVIRPIIVDARLCQLSVEDLNTRITKVQVRLDRITEIRDSKL